VPETRLPFTYIVKGRYWRFRRGDLKAGLPGKPGDPAFHKRYGELVALSEGRAPEPSRDTFAWLIAQIPRQRRVRGAPPVNPPRL
jgi:hypothetical protein